MNMRQTAVPGDWSRKLREFFYGFYAIEFERQALEMRGEIESVFMLITFGDMLGRIALDLGSPRPSDR